MSICVYVRGSELDQSKCGAMFHKGGESTPSFVYLVRFEPATRGVFAVVMWVYVQEGNII